MEIGVWVTLCLPKPWIMNSISGPRRLPVWLKLDGMSADVRWATLEQKKGRPVEEGRIPLCEVLDVQNTGACVELSIQGQSRPTSLEFNTPAEREAWARYLDLAFKVLGVD